MKREKYNVDIRDGGQRRIEVLQVVIETETRFDDRALAAIRADVVAWCAKKDCEFCGLSIARGAAGSGGEPYLLARVRSLVPARIPVTRRGRPIGDPIDREAPTMASRRRSDQRGRA